MLAGKRILLGVSGSIAAYKAASLVRLLKKEGASVKVVLTPAASDFITPLTLSTLSEEPVHSHYVANSLTGEWVNHVDLGLWADLMLVAPATANTISAFATGQASELLHGVFLSLRCPVMLAPAMDLDMFANQATIENIKILSQRGVHVLDSPDGELASGLSGKGRMMEPEDIVEEVKQFLSANLPLSGKKVLVSAGATYEAIDPVRFIGNRSSGKMGYALAEVAARLGAQVTLVTGPATANLPKGIAKVIHVESAKEMYNAMLQAYIKTDICIMSAAVADYTPAEVSKQKIKKSDDELTLRLVKTNDILKELGRRKINQFLVGFALETQDEVKNAIGKLQAKNANMIILNTQGQNTGAGSVTNEVVIVEENNTVTLPLQVKEKLAEQIWQHILEKV